MATITSCIAPKSWQSAGGPGTIAPAPATLAVAQNEAVQGQIAGLLDALRCVRRSPTALEPIVVECPAIAPAAAAIRAKLARREDIEFPQPLTLAGLRDWLEARDIPSVVDSKALSDAKIPTDVRLTFDRVKNVSLDWVLHRLLSQADLGFCLDGDLLVLTTAEAAPAASELVVYPVADLLAAQQPPGADEPPDFQSLIDMLTSTIAPQTWDPSGGTGIVSPVRSAKALLVAQSLGVQGEIARLLAVLRTRPPDRKPAAEQSPPANSPVVRIYALAPPSEGAKDTAADSARADRYVAVVRDLVEPKGWTDGSGYIAAVPGSIVVRGDARSAEGRVEKLLRDMGALPGSQGVNAAQGGNGRGGFGGGAFAVPDSTKLRRPRSIANQRQCRVPIHLACMGRQMVN